MNGQRTRPTSPKRPAAVLSAAARRRAKWRRRAYFLLESDGSPDPWAIAIRFGLIAVVLLNVAVALAATDPQIRHDNGGLLVGIELATLLLFTVEYVARLWSAVEHPRYHGLPHWRARLRYALTPAAIVDLAVILPLAIAPFVALDLSSFLFLRIIRLLKLFRYSGGMAALGEAVFAERRALLACAVILLAIVLISASSITYAERAAQPDAFGSVIGSLWWTIVTITTVGYGDVVPVTPLGRAIAVVTMVVGFAFIALPTAILSSSFAEVIRRRDFTITWGMIGRVPAFANLDAATIVRIMPRLVARTFHPGDIVVHRNEEPADLHIVVFGVLEAEGLDDEEEDGGADAASSGHPPLPEPVVFQEGDMFGGPIPMRGFKTAGPVVSTGTSRFLILPEDDLRVIARRRPDVYALLTGGLDPT
ncbi:cyclic nucleotide-gated ion channel [Amorphus coralli]|uniref:cyclic nucleotide-gated ion channel n=1 Tax=Amorphus coralli TaxID=340680 RepID=UPI00035E718F|nr:cyclic nucleotide-gated ion channel [Amorphus coralli]